MQIGLLFKIKKYDSVRCGVFLSLGIFIKICTMNPGFELLVKYFQDSIGLNCDFEFRSAGSEQPMQSSQKQILCLCQALWSRTNQCILEKACFPAKLVFLSLLSSIRCRCFFRKILLCQSSGTQHCQPFLGVGLSTFRLLKANYLNCPHFNTIVLGLEIKTNRKDPDSDFENLLPIELLFHEETTERQLFLYCAKQTKSAASLL